MKNPCIYILEISYKSSVSTLDSGIQVVVKLMIDITYLDFFIKESEICCVCCYQGGHTASFLVLYYHPQAECQTVELALSLQEDLTSATDTRIWQAHRLQCHQPWGASVIEVPGISPSHPRLINASV